MAIAKMHKIRVVTLKKHAEFLYSVLQSIQVVEPKVVSGATLEESEDYEDKLRDSMTADEELIRLQTLKSRISNAMKFLERHIPQKSFREKHGVPTPIFTLEELDDEVEKHDVTDLVRELHQIRDRLVNIDVEVEEQLEKEDFLISWHKLRLTPQDIDDFKYVGIIAGTVPQTADNEYVDRLKANPALVVEEVLHTDDLFGFVAYYNIEDRDQIIADLQEIRFDRLHYPYEKIPSEEVKDTRQYLDNLRETRKEIIEELNTRTSDMEILQLAYEYYYAAEQRRRATHLALKTDNLHAFEGWIEIDKTDEMEAFIYQNIPQNELLIEYSNIEDEEIDDVPIKLNNNAVTEPFETVTKMYALPKYNELDPTPWVMPFYMLFFGMMLADLGYGLILWGITFFMLRFMNLKNGMKKNVKFFHLLSYPTMIVGLIYGSLFGVTIPTQIINLNEQAVEVLIGAMAIGIVHLILALALNVYTNFKLGKPLTAVKDGLTWITVLVAAVVAALAGAVFNNSALLNGSLIALGIALVVVVIISTIQEKSKFAGFMWGVYDVYGVSGYIGDIVSYSRLMALGMSGGSIASAFNLLVGMLPVWARFTIGIVLIIGLHLFNLFLSGLSGYVHGLRLVFVEFFGKFYEGGGRAFEPLKAKEDYILIEQKKKYIEN